MKLPLRHSGSTFHKSCLTLSLLMISSLPGAWAATVGSYSSLDQAVATTLRQRAKLIPPPTARAVGASVSTSGNRSLVGGIGSDGATGSAFVFVQNGATWSQEAELKSSDVVVNDGFGFTVSLSGNRALVGASQTDGTGAAYVFVFDGATWTQEAKLTPAGAPAGANFGYAVSLSGGRALIGAFTENNTTGAAYVFTLRNRRWSQTARLTSPTAAVEDYFGSDVSISGTRALVGAFGTASFTGSAFVYALTRNSWNLEGTLTAADGLPGDFFADSVSISGDRALVGASADDNGAFGNGSAYVFVANGTTWTQEAKLSASDPANNDNFGWSVSLSGLSALVGSPNKTRSQGAAYLFAFDGTTWTQQQRLIATDTIDGDRFGLAVSLLGTRALIGARDSDVNQIPTGSAYIFGP